MRKRLAEVGVGQLVLTFESLFEEDCSRHDAQETEGNGPAASSASLAARSKAGRKRKWHSLIDKVYAYANLRRAWVRVRRNGGASGIDGVSVRKFGEGASQRLAVLSEDLRRRTYRPQPVKRVFIPKSGGGQRPLGVPTVRDRIVQQALLQVLEPIFEGVFSNRSHGFRPARGCQTALEVVDRAIAHGYGWVVDADVRAFFDSVDHAKLVCALNEEIADGRVLDLITRILRAGVGMPGVADIEPTKLGTPQGGPLSPLLANVYLHAFDVAITQAGYGLVRYADDFVIFARSEGEAKAAHSLCQQVLEGELGLSLHPEKTRVVSVDAGFEFLGFHYFRHPKAGVRCKEVRTKSVQRFRDAIRRRTPRLRTQRKVKARTLTHARLSKNERVRELIGGLSRYLRSWHGYFRAVRTPYADPFQGYDRFVRRRLRTSLTGRTGNGWWTRVLTNDLLARLGLVSLAECHAKYLGERLHAPARKG